MSLLRALLRILCLGATKKHIIEILIILTQFTNLIENQNTDEYVKNCNLTNQVGRYKNYQS